MRHAPCTLPKVLQGWKCFNSVLCYCRVSAGGISHASYLYGISWSHTHENLLYIMIGGEQLNRYLRYKFAVIM